MTDPLDDDPFNPFDKDYLPKKLYRSATMVGEKVAYTWVDDRPSRDIANLLVWHWCDHNVWHADPAKNPDYIPNPGWVPTGVGAHTLVQVQPLHLEASIFWPGCCGLHGWIRNGKWVTA